MFEPFVLDAIQSFGRDGYDIERVRRSLAERSDLSVPVNTLRTLMQRIVRRGYAIREGGRYFPSDQPIPSQDLPARRSQVELEQRDFAGALCDYAAQVGYSFESTEDALASILEFIERFHVSIALGDSPALPVDEQNGERTARGAVVANFLQNQLVEAGAYAGILQQTLEGYVLQNTLLLKDIASASRRFDNLKVYIDTGIVLGLLGFRGDAMQTAMKEFVHLLREAGGIPAVYDVTLREFRSILAAHEEKLGTYEGRMSLHQTDVTRFLLTHHYSPSDVASEGALAELKLNHLGVNVRVTPNHREATTLGEADLSLRLADRADGDRDPRVRHDVDCIAGVLTTRRGHTSDSIDSARAIFATTSGLTVRNCRAWYESQGGRGVPPIIHYLDLSNLAWIKRPSSATSLKLHELVALCGAALRPSRKAWDAFLKYLQSLQDSGELTSDEVTAVVVNALTERLLAEETLDDDYDAECLGEVVERVRASYRADADKQVAEARESERATEARAEEIRAEIEAASQAEVAAAQEKVLRAEREASEVRTSLERRSGLVARIICWVPYVLVALALAAGLVLTLISMGTGERLDKRALVFAALLAVVGLLSAVWGFNLRGWRLAMEKRVAIAIKGWFSGAT